ncbi:MAG TPA: alpha/beta fold hydrolase [Chitinophagaceae bacterium]
MSTHILHAQSDAKLLGTWEGKIMVGVSLRIVFHFSKDSAGHLIAFCDSPDQGGKDIPCSDARLNGDSVHLQIPEVQASYRGRMVSDSLVTGLFVQGTGIPLTLKKVAVVTALKRPQTPVPPFPYRSEDVEYDNSDKSLHYGATITIPPGKGPFPAVVLITGSGAQNRDEEIFEHKPFAVLADYLARRGIIALRVDDRGIGKSSRGPAGATTADFAGDVNVSMDYLKNRPETDKKKLGLIGHSEGGMIAPMVADQRKDIRFIVLLAGPGEKISTLMEEQNAAVLLSKRITQAAVDAYLRLYRAVVPAIVTAPDKATAEKRAKDIFLRWKDSTNKNYVLTLTGVHDEKSTDNLVASFVGTVYAPWFRYFVQFDPQPWLQQLHCSVLALNGSKDIQVIAKSNLAGIEAALKKSKSRSFEVHELPGLNHLFQTCKKCTVEEYGELEETFSPAALQIIGDWIAKNAQ